MRTIVWRTALIIEAEAMASVDAALAEQVSSWGALSMKKTEQAIDALVDKFDPGALRRSRTASRARDVVIGSPTDEAGFTSLCGRLYAPDAAALDRRLEAMARAVCAEDPRTLAERRADALGALAAGGDRLGCECAAPTALPGSTTEHPAPSVSRSPPSSGSKFPNRDTSRLRPCPRTTTQNTGITGVFQSVVPVARGHTRNLNVGGRGLPSAVTVSCWWR